MSRPARRSAPVSAFDSRRAPWLASRPKPALPSSFPEIDCIRPLLPPGFAEVAEWRSVQVGVGADRVLVTAGHIAEETYLRSLAASLGVAFETLDRRDRAACALPDARLAHAAVTGILPLRIGGELTWVIAPRGIAARTLTRLLTARPALRARIRLTSAERLSAYVARHGMAAIGRGAADGLKVAQPLMSAAAPPRWRPVPLAALAMLVLAAFAAPHAPMAAVGVSLAIFFLAWIVFRLSGAVAPRRVPAPLVRVPDDRLPTFTIVVALYREAEVVEGLVSAGTCAIRPDICHPANGGKTAF